MKEQFLAIGAGSFIAQHWAHADSSVLLSSRQNLSSATDACSVVVNFALDPMFKQQDYSEDFDQDLKVARWAASKNRHFIMLSTRKVYQVDLGHPLEENSLLAPMDHYGRNKLESEQRISKLLGDRLTILRLSNVYGYEFNRRSFFGLAQTRLRREGRIVFDISPFVARDFIAMSQLAPILSRVCSLRPTGTFNVGSGVALQLGRIAQWLIQGYGRGILEIVALDDRDSFVMNPARLYAVLGMQRPAFDFKQHIKALGARLAHE